MKAKATKQVDGYRWMLSQDPYSGRYRAISQKRCEMDSGRVYYKYGTTYEFDTEEDAKEFVRDQPATEWF